MHTMMMIMTKIGAENADDHVDDVAVTMTPTMMDDDNDGNDNDDEEEDDADKDGS